MKVILSTEIKTPLVVIAQGGRLGRKLKEFLDKEKVRTIVLHDATMTIPAWEKPDYVFFFGNEKEQWENLTGRKILIGDAELPGASGKVRIIGKWREDDNWILDTAKKIMRFGFSNNRELVIVGKGAYLNKDSLKHEQKTLEERLTNLIPHKKRIPDKRLKLKLVLGILILFLAVPFLGMGYFTTLGFVKVGLAVRAFKHNDSTKAHLLANQAMDSFESVKQGLKYTNNILPIRYFYLLDLGEKTADLISRSSVLLPKIMEMTDGITEKEVASVRLELSPIDQDLGFIEGQIDFLGQTRLFNLLGIPDATLEISRVRQIVNQADQVLSVLGEIIPLKARQAKNYLVVLQNSAELRPTGGFIGSYALVNFSGGRLANYKIYDVYTADGQLRGHINPPDEILHYLGQPSWYMRDANWSPDFLLTAKRLEWFLEKETGQSVDGVIGINLGAVQKLLKATGPITLANSNETVTADNFFEKAEFAAEINFFPGSEQKPQYLSQVAQGLLAKLTNGGGVDWWELGKVADQMAKEKDVTVYFNSELAETVILDNGWGGTINKKECLGKQTNCLFLVEANVGSNKANYFVKRSLRIDTLVGKAGDIVNNVTINYRNDSPNASWPGGEYSNYLRILLPAGTNFDKIDLGDKREATFSGVLTAGVIKQTTEDQFLVFKNKELNYDSYGVQVVVPVQGEKTVKFSYRPSLKLDFGSTQTPFYFSLWKQPGVTADVVDFSLDYPSFLTPVWDLQSGKNISLLALPQKLVYNMDLSQDRMIKINFRR